MSDIKSDIDSDCDPKYSLNNSADPKNVQELTIYVSLSTPFVIETWLILFSLLLHFQVQNLLQNVQDKFQSMSDQIITRIDDMGNRIDDLEKSIGDLMNQAGIEAPIKEQWTLWMNYSMYKNVCVERVTNRKKINRKSANKNWIEKKESTILSTKQIIAFVIDHLCESSRIQAKSTQFIREKQNNSFLAINFQCDRMSTLKDEQFLHIFVKHRRKSTAK